MNSGFQQLSHLLESLACAPVQAQGLLDLEAERAQASWLSLLTTSGLVNRADDNQAFDFLRACVPVRQVLQKYEIDVELRLVVEKKTGLSIGARSLDLGWEHIWRSEERSTCRVQLLVESLPLPAMPSAIAGLPVAADITNNSAKGNKHVGQQTD